MAPDRAAAARAIAAFLQALGHDPERDPELRGTPEAVASSFADELLAGYSVDVPALLEGAACAAIPSDDVVLMRDVSVSSMCPHHLMPSFGSADIAYVPGRALLGLGALARLVEAFARRLTLQETIARNVVEALVAHAAVRGARCTLTLRHTCYICRGPQEINASITTTAAVGCLLEPAWAARVDALLSRGASR
jgi:GTP cyclohydrolase I